MDFVEISLIIWSMGLLWTDGRRRKPKLCSLAAALQPAQKRYNLYDSSHSSSKTQPNIQHNTFTILHLSFEEIGIIKSFRYICRKYCQEAISIIGSELGDSLILELTGVDRKRVSSPFSSLLLLILLLLLTVSRWKWKMEKFTLHIYVDTTACVLPGSCSCSSSQGSHQDSRVEWKFPSNIKTFRNDITV